MLTFKLRPYYISRLLQRNIFLQRNTHNYMESSVALHNSKGNGKLTYIGPNVIDTLLDIIILSKDVHFEISE